MLNQKLCKSVLSLPPCTLFLQQWVWAGTWRHSASLIFILWPIQCAEEASIWRCIHFSCFHILHTPDQGLYLLYPWTQRAATCKNLPILPMNHYYCKWSDPRKHKFRKITPTIIGKHFPVLLRRLEFEFCNHNFLFDPSVKDVSSGATRIESAKPHNRIVPLVHYSYVSDPEHHVSKWEHMYCNVGDRNIDYSTWMRSQQSNDRFFLPGWAPSDLFPCLLACLLACLLVPTVHAGRKTLKSLVSNWRSCCGSPQTLHAAGAYKSFKRCQSATGFRTLTSKWLRAQKEFEAIYLLPRMGIPKLGGGIRRPSYWMLDQSTPRRAKTSINSRSTRSAPRHPAITTHVTNCLGRSSISTTVQNVYEARNDR